MAANKAQKRVLKPPISGTAFDEKALRPAIDALEEETRSSAGQSVGVLHSKGEKTLISVDSKAL
jgi:hypothetical protein